MLSVTLRNTTTVHYQHSLTSSCYTLHNTEVVRLFHYFILFSYLLIQKKILFVLFYFCLYFLYTKKHFHKDILLYAYFLLLGKLIIVFNAKLPSAWAKKTKDFTMENSLLNTHVYNSGYNLAQKSTHEYITECTYENKIKNEIRNKI